MRYNHYVVQSQHDCSQFSTIEIARKHAELNSPATIWRGSDVTEIQGSCLSHKAEAKPLETI